MAILGAVSGGGGGSPTRSRPPRVGPAPAINPLAGTGYSKKAVARAVRNPAPPRPVVSKPAPAPRPVAAPKPPPVVVPNNKGSYSRPQAPPPIKAGPVQGAGGKPNSSQSIAKPPPKGAGKTTPIKPPIAPTPAPTPAPIQASVPTAPAPVVPGIDQFLGTDEGYLGQQSALQQALAGFQSEQGNARTSGAASFAQRLRDLQQAQVTDESDLQENFASRGLVKSGSYADALAQLQQQYLGSQGNLQTEQAGFESGLQQDFTNYQAQQKLAQQQAQQEAIARRAAQYGL